MSSIPVDILYEHGPLLAVYKPAGLLTQSPPGIDSMEDRIKRLLADRQPDTESTYLGVPHRLDRPVAGAMVFALRRRAARKLAEQFEARTVCKRYWACVAGEVEPRAGVWKDHLVKVPGEARAEIVPADTPNARLAVLRYRTLGQTSHGSWLEFEPLTGRTHQIRVQAAAHGWPVLGDELYGSQIPFGTQHEDSRLRAIALHARWLSLWHPTTRERLRVTAPLTFDWQTLGIMG